MKHKWYKEIKAWANGAEIQYRKIGCDKWHNENTTNDIYWDSTVFEYRIKPQPKEPQYLYVYQMGGKIELAPIKRDTLKFICGDREIPFSYSGKIKLEMENE